MSDERMVLVRASGRDRPGITARLLAVLAAAGVALHDMEQVVVRERLTLDILIGVGPGDDVLKDLLFAGWEAGIHIDFEVVEDTSSRASLARHVVTVIGRSLSPAAVGGVTSAIAAGGGNIDRIIRLASYPVVSYEFVVVDGDAAAMRAGMVAAAGEHGVDVAIQREGLERRAKRLVLLDVDSTLIQDEVLELLAEEAGCADEVRAITERAMSGQMEFGPALQQRVRLLAGTPAAAVDRVRGRIRLTPGARTFTRTLHRLGYTVAIVSGGFRRVIEPIASDLGISHAYANELEVVGGVITGELSGPIIDRQRKAELLRDIAASERVPLEQTVAVGDGANDLDMLAAAGLGIAFNAKPVVRAAADTAVSVPYLDAILFVLGIRRDEVEAADEADPTRPGDDLVAAPGTAPA